MFSGRKKNIFAGHWTLNDGKLLKNIVIKNFGSRLADFGISGSDITRFKEFARDRFPLRFCSGEKCFCETERGKNGGAVAFANPLVLFSGKVKIRTQIIARIITDLRD